MKQKSNTLTTMLWMLLGVAVLGLAFWQARVTVEREKKQALALPAPPTHTHSAGRASWEPVNVIADFEAQAKKGMTDEQILFIIQDFKDAGLASPPDKVSHEYEKTQHRWYHRILKHWLNLSRDQSNEAARSLSDLLSKPSSDDLSVDPFQIGFFYYGDSRIGQITEYQPWKLCALTPEQSALTWKNWIEHGYSLDEDFTLLSRSSKYNSELHSKATGAPLFSPLLKLHGEFDRCARLIPFLQDQKIFNSEAPLETPNLTPDDPFESPTPESTNRFREALHRLHPAQLEYMLLTNPEIAGTAERLITQEVDQKR